MYKNGNGVPQDYEAAFKWYSLAAEQGDAASQNNLGFMYAEGQGTKQDLNFAYMWWDISASQGDKVALNNLKIFEAEMSSAEMETAQLFSFDYQNVH